MIDTADVNGTEDRYLDDEPETDQEFVRVRRDEDDEIYGEIVQAWHWIGDPLGATFDTARDAMAAADDYFGEALDWWEEEEDVWFAGRPTEAKP